jgi:hypothetical protein
MLEHASVALFSGIVIDEEHLTAWNHENPKG